MISSHAMVPAVLAVLLIVAPTAVQAETAKCHDGFECAHEETSLLQTGSTLSRTLDIAATEGQKLMSVAESKPQFDCNSDDSVLVYTRPKTGSSGLIASFASLCGCTLDHSNMSCGEHLMLKTHGHEDDGPAATFLSQAVPNNSRVWVFTIVRDPFKRAPSLYFERLSETNRPVPGTTNLHIRLFHQWLGEEPTNKSQMSFLEADAAYLDGLAKRTGVHFDVSQFNTSQHHAFASTTLPGNKTLHMMLLRLEDHDQWTEVLSGYAPGFEFYEEQNVMSDDDNVSDLYADFKERVMYSDSERSQILQTSDALQFYSAVEVADMLMAPMVASPR